MLKTDYPIEIDGNEYESFAQWNVTYNDYVTVHETEGGTQEDVITRKGRRSIGVSTTCLDYVATQLSGLNDKSSFNVKYYEVKEGDYITLRMRVAPGSMSISLKQGSGRLRSTNGVYTVAFTLEEF